MPYREDIASTLRQFHGGHFTELHWETLAARIEEWITKNSFTGSHPRPAVFAEHHPLSILIHALSRRTGIHDSLLRHELFCAPDTVQSMVFEKGILWASQSKPTLRVCDDLLRLANATRQMSRWDTLDATFTSPLRSSNFSVVLKRLMHFNGASAHPARIQKVLGPELKPSQMEWLMVAIVKQGEAHLARAFHHHLSPGTILRHAVKTHAHRSFGYDDSQSVLNCFQPYLEPCSLDAWALDTWESPASTFDLMTRVPNAGAFEQWGKRWHFAASLGLLTNDYAYQMVKQMTSAQSPLKTDTFDLPLLM